MQGWLVLIYRGMMGMDDESLGELLDAGYRYALALCHGESQAGDLVQEAWLSVLRAGKRTPSKAYLFRAIRSRHIDYHRSAAERYRDRSGASIDNVADQHSRSAGCELRASPCK